MVQFRTGLGHDIHRLVPGKNLVLGGVLIPPTLVSTPTPMVTCSAMP